MSQSETVGKIAEALAKAQGQIKSAIKGKENPFFRSSYADLPAVMEACRQALSENGIAVSQTTDFDLTTTDISPPLVWLETKLLHSSGEWISGRYLIRPTKDDPQGLGSAITYARRYALAAMVGVVAENEDDDGEAAVGRESPPRDISKDKPKPAKPTDAQAKSAAIEWAKGAKKDLESITIREQLTAWKASKKGWVDKLKLYDEDHYNIIVMAIADAEKRVT